MLCKVDHCLMKTTFLLIGPYWKDIENINVAFSLILGICAATNMFITEISLNMTLSSLSSLPMISESRDVYLFIKYFMSIYLSFL